MHAYPGPTLSLGAEFHVPTDILVPSALHDVIDVDLAKTLDASLVVEGANMPTTDEGKEMLHARGIPIVPDFIANAGGVIAAAYSMDGRYSPFRTEPEQVFRSIS